jgi:hypothetical protein
MTAQAKAPHTERLVGRVESVNEKGVKIDGEWRNFSRYAKPGAIATVESGVRVECQIDNAGFVRSLTLADAATKVQNDDFDASDAVNAAEAEVGSVSLKDSMTMKDALILRQTCIKAASEFAASRPDLKSTDVLKIAECWERWVVR